MTDALPVLPVILDTLAVSPLYKVVAEYVTDGLIAVHDDEYVTVMLLIFTVLLAEKVTEVAVPLQLPEV